MPGAQAVARSDYDAIVVGGGHNGLVAAILLTRRGWSVLILERACGVGGAAVSGTPFPAVDARLSRYAYLVSLFPAALRRDLGLEVEIRRRAVASYSPADDRGLLVTDDPAATRASMARVTGDAAAFDDWERFFAMIRRLAGRLFPTLLQPLRSRTEMRRLIGDDRAWEALFVAPLSTVLERTFASDLVRGLVLTDATIGTFAPADDPELRQNRCFLYHVIGNGTGAWDVPVGGMGMLTGALERQARAFGAEIRTRAEVTAIDTDGALAEVRCADGRHYTAGHVLVNAAPAVLDRLLGHAVPDPRTAHRRTQPAPDPHTPHLRTSPPAGGHRPPPRPEGSQLKINMLLSRLPRLRDPAVTPSQAFAGTFHVGEGYGQLQAAYAHAAAGLIPERPPCEVYCHSLTDPTILSGELAAAGAHTLTLFGLHMPARLFTGPDAAIRKQDAVAATLRSLDEALAEPVEGCLWRAPDGSLCIEALTPPELEAQLALPGGHIFHRDLAWPFAESEEEVGRWGVETEHANVWICGAGARRGGGVSGIPGHNAARAVLEARPDGRARRQRFIP